MIGYFKNGYDNDKYDCIWLPVGPVNKRKIVSICKPTVIRSKWQFYQDEILPPCQDCLRIAAQIAKDAKTMEGEK